MVNTHDKNSLPTGVCHQTSAPNFHHNHSRFDLQEELPKHQHQLFPIEHLDCITLASIIMNLIEKRRIRNFSSASTVL